MITVVYKHLHDNAKPQVSQTNKHHKLEARPNRSEKTKVTSQWHLFAKEALYWVWLAIRAKHFLSSLARLSIWTCIGWTQQS